MHVSGAAIDTEHAWVRDRADVVVPLINDVREGLGSAFGVDVEGVEVPMYRDAVDATFTDVDRAVNVTALVMVLRELDVEGDYPGFVVDELVGRELAGSIAGAQPLRLIAESTFHYADMVTVNDGSDAGAGRDDLDAALAAGYQTVLPGWEWRAADPPF